jgi:hypothetical protein
LGLSFCLDSTILIQLTGLVNYELCIVNYELTLKLF